MVHNLYPTDGNVIGAVVGPVVGAVVGVIVIFVIILIIVLLVRQFLKTEDSDVSCFLSFFL